MARRILLGMLVLINLVLFFRLIWTDHGILAYMNMEKRSNALQSQLQDVDEKSLELSNEIRRLKGDRAYQEMVIRKRMNYVKNNEVLYVFTGGNDSVQGAVDDGQKN